MSETREESECELRAENERLYKEIAGLATEARSATLRTFLRRRVLPAGWVAARCDYILGVPVKSDSRWRVLGESRARYPKETP